VWFENDSLPLNLIVDLRNKYKPKIRLESLESNAFIFKDSPFDAYNHSNRINFCGSLFQNEKKQVDLPKTIGVWTLQDSVQRVDSKNIFKYMNGA